MSYQWLMRNSDDFGVRQTISKTDKRDRFRALKRPRNGVKTKRTVSSPKYPQRAGNALESFLRTNRVWLQSLYSFLAEHIDPTCGAVVAEQQFLADKLNVSRSTIKRWLNYLETKNAVVRIPVAGNVCAYALDPHEVWKGYNSSKGYAAFVSKTLVNVDGDVQRRIVAMFKGQEGDAKDQCDLPLE